MPVINRKSVAAPVLPKETVSVEALGGEVVVCGLRLTEGLALQERMRKLRAAITPEEQAQGVDPAMAIVPELLHKAVTDDEGQAVFSPAQWQDFGGCYAEQAVGLFNVAMRLSGFDKKGDEKN